MSERGVIAIDRGVFDHDCFADEPFTEREAWMWLIAEAAWRPRARRIGRVALDLRRGQLAASLRFMAERWGWNKDRVDRFLERLKNRDMIETQTATGISVITICNYSTYQRVSLPDETAAATQTETATRQQRDKREDIKNIEEESGGGSRASLISEEAFEISNEVMAILSIDQKFIPPGWCGAPMRIQGGLNAGWKREVILIAARRVAAGKRDGPPDSFAYLEKPIAREHEIASKPLPVVVIDQIPEVIHAHTDSGRHHPGGAFGASRDKYRAAYAKLADFAEGGDEPGDREGGAGIVEILPAARRN